MGTVADLPTSGNAIGDARVVEDTESIYVWSGTAWIQIAGGGGSSITSLMGDVSATGPGAASATVNSVGGKASADIATATTTVDAATSANIANTLVERNASGSFSAGMITASLIGNATTATTITGVGNLTDPGTDGIVVTGGVGAIVGSGTQLAQHVADASHNGYLDAADWNTFNNKLDRSAFNDITGGNNGTFEVDTIGWNLYNNQGRTNPATLADQDLTYTSALPAGGGNGVEIEYIYNASFPAATPNINVISSSHVQVQWNNGPTVSNNPTPAQIITAWNAVPAALAIATVANTGSSTRLQFINGTLFLSGGGDASPVDGTGGVVAGVTFTRNTSTPLEGVASGDIGKDAVNRQGQGISTDFIIPALDKGQELQIDVAHEGSSGMVLGANSDVQIFIYDITNSSMIPVTPVRTLAGPVNTIKTFTGVFTASNTSVNYRLIFHIATTNATVWDLLIDAVVVDDIITPGVATQVPSLVLLNQPISGAVTDHMCVMWKDGASAWIPATIAGAALPTFGDDVTQLGFATNIVGLTASIYIRGFMDGFSIGPFVGFTQYIDNIAGGISPLPSPFNDMYVSVGIGSSSSAINIQFDPHVDLIANSSGTPLKGGLLTNSAINDGTGDQVLVAGANGAVPFYNSAAALGIQTGAAVVAAAPFTYTLATRTLTAATATNSIAGFLSAADHTTFAAAAPLASPALTGTPTAPTAGAGTSTTQLATTAFVTTADNLKAPLASPALTGTPTAPTAVAGTNTTQVATTAFVTTADNLKANAASPTFTGDVNSSTGNVLISTIGKGLSIKTGTNAKVGTATLVGGTKTVANTSVTVNSHIFLSDSTPGGTLGQLSYSKSAGVGFTITSSNVLDTSTIDWFIVEFIP